MPRPVRVSDLQHDTGYADEGGELLKCFVCGKESCAERRDYFGVARDYVFKCCRRNMSLVTKQVTYKEVIR